MDEMVRCLKAMADETRLRAVLLLQQGDLSVCELMAILQVPQPLVSRHLSVLRGAGLVEGRKAGKLHIYSLSEGARRGGKVGLVGLVARNLQGDAKAARDTVRMKKCREYEKKTGRCDMETLGDFAAMEVGR